MPSFMKFEQISRVLWIKMVDSPPYTTMFQAKNLGTLVLNHGHFEGNSCELRILSQWICDLDIPRLLKR